ncbi:MAG: hypothetical protein JO317_02015, partial [Verrucomicrobiae bacterium]|nr:hypothetical protein [Verrucomicrobiae bacterium]
MRSWQQAVVLAVLTVLVYAASLGNGFVYDDHVYVQQNPQVHGGPLAEIFRKSFP